MKQQLIVSGIGGQGVLFLTRVIAQAAVNRQMPVLTAETHGMAQRGGTVLSTIKVGDFASPLIRAGQVGRGLGAYGVQAAIAECHAVAPSVEATDWDRIVVLYEALGRIAPSPVVGSGPRPASASCSVSNTSSACRTWASTCSVPTP